MRVLLVSDVHANPAALAAVRERYDVCLFLGDLVDYGTLPGPCIAWVRDRAHYAVRGNHDHGAAQDVAVSAVGGFKYLTAVTRPLTVARMSEPERRFLADLPVTRTVTLDGRRFLLVHATPRDPMDEWAPAEIDFWRQRLEGVEADVVCVGHTHQQYALRVGDTMVVNPGSVGLQRDGDPRAGYAVVEGTKVTHVRAEYDVEQAVRAVEDSPLPEDAKAMLAGVYRTGRLAV